MGNTTNQKARILNNIMTSTQEEISSTCSAKCDTSADNNVVIVAGRTKGVRIEAKCTASADCIMSDQVISTIENTLASAVTQDAKSVTDLFNDGIFTNKMDSSVNIKTTIANNTTQIMQSTCQSTATGSASNNFVYVTPTGSSRKEVYISTETDAQSSCTMTNLAKSLTQNQVSNNVDQKSRNIGMFAYIFMVILAIVVVGGVVLIILGATGVLGSAFKGSGTGKPGETTKPGAPGATPGTPDASGGGLLNDVEKLATGANGGGQGGIAGEIQQLAGGATSGAGGGGGLAAIAEEAAEVAV